MRGDVLVAVAIAAILGITCVTVLEDPGDVEAATEDVIITSASGTIGNGVNWSFSNGALTITQATGTGSKTIATGLDSDSTSTSGWGSTWKVTGHTESTSSTEDGTNPQTSASTTNTINDSSITPKQVFGSGTFKVTIDAGISIADGAFANIRASEVGFSAIGNTTATIGEGAFENCITLTKVDLGHVTSVGTDAFRGCTVLNSVSNAGSMETISAGAFSNCGSLETVDIGTSKTVDQTAFQGCAKLATISVSDSNTSYNRDSATGLIYTEDYHTLYICPPAKTGAITSVNPAVTTVNLDYANVDYIINLDDLTGGDVEFVAVTGAKASGIAFSTQSMSQISSASISGTTFTMRYALYDGWTVNSTVATVLDGSSRATVTSATETELSFTVVDGHGYMVYPVGYASITPDDLNDADEIEGWAVEINGLVYGSDDKGRVTDLIDYDCTIIGYTGDDGDAVLRTTLYNGAAECSVNGMSSGDYGGIESLSVEGTMSFSDGIFANCNSLRSVTMPEAESISAQMFRYCTQLRSVDIGSCRSIGDYAFEGCSSLSSVDIGAKDVSIGTGAFSNCPSMELLKVGNDTAVTGNPGLFVVHSDLDADFDVCGDNLVISGLDSIGAVSYSAESASTGLTAQVSRDGWVSLYIAGLDQMHVSGGTGSRSDSYLVVFDSQLGVRVDSMSVAANSAIADLPVPSKEGYTFEGWYTDEGCTQAFDPESRVTHSQVLYADWTRDNTGNNTPIYVLAIFAAAVIGTVAVLFMNSRR